MTRFRPTVEPESDPIVAAIEANLGSAPTRTVKSAEVKVGDRLLAPGGDGLLVTRIDEGMFGSDMLAFVEDSPARWAKMPLPPDAEIELLN